MVVGVCAMIINRTVPAEVLEFGPDTQQRGKTAQGVVDLGAAMLDAVFLASEPEHVR
jgi:hypothetical protein